VVVQPASAQFTRTMFVDITERVLMEQRSRLEAQNTYLHEEKYGEQTLAKSLAAVLHCSTLLRQVDQIARIYSTVLILGETGTGRNHRPRHPRPQPRKSQRW